MGLIGRLANEGLEYLGHHGPVTSMGVPRQELPSWDNIQFVTAQPARRPQLDDVPVGTEVVIGPNAAKPLTLDIPILVSEMSFGALSEEAKVALARGAERAGTNNCPVGIATQRPELRARLPVEAAAGRLHNFFSASVELMAVLARACGHTHLGEFCAEDLTTFDRDMAHLTDISFGGVRL